MDSFAALCMIHCWVLVNDSANLCLVECVCFSLSVCVGVQKNSILCVFVAV